MEPITGRREQNKRRTRRAIRLSAMDLFEAHGFDHVTMAQVATTAGVSPATVFNYFATKEDLFFGQVRQLERELAALVAAVPSGGSILSALQGHVLYELTAGRAYTDPRKVTSFHAMVAISADLRSREAEIYERRAAVLTEALVEAGQKPLIAGVAARHYIAAEQLVAAELRRLVAQGAPSRRMLRALDGYIDEVFQIVRTGVGDLSPSEG